MCTCRGRCPRLRFRLPTPTQWWEIMEKANILLYISYMERKSMTGAKVIELYLFRWPDSHLTHTKTKSKSFPTNKVGHMLCIFAYIWNYILMILALRQQDHSTLYNPSNVMNNIINSNVDSWRVMMDWSGTMFMRSRTVTLVFGCS